VLEIGDDTAFNINCWFGVTTRVTVEGTTLFGPFVTVTDGNHRYGEVDQPVWSQGLDTRPIVIGRNVWIGAKATLINSVGANCVVGANAVVTRPAPGRCGGRGGAGPGPRSHPRRRGGGPRWMTSCATTGPQTPAPRPPRRTSRRSCRTSSAAPRPDRPCRRSSTSVPDAAPTSPLSRRARRSWWPRTCRNPRCWTRAAATPSSGRSWRRWSLPGQTLPFADGAFRLTVCTEVLEHVPDLAVTADELQRVTASGGHLIVSTPNYRNVMGIVKRWRDWRSGREDWDPWHAHAGGLERFMTPKRLRAAFSGCEVVEHTGADFTSALGIGWPPLRRRVNRWLLLRPAEIERLKTFGMQYYLLLRKP
jgi:hypothetical protein